MIGAMRRSTLNELPLASRMQPSLPQVTAIITTHRRPLHLREALASVREETFRDVECLVVEDGDGGGATELPGHVRMLRGHRLGIGGARNLGLAAARGEYVIFLDDDDVALPCRISTLLEAALRSGADLCYGLTRRVMADCGGLSLPDVPTRQHAFGPVGFCDLLTCNPHVNSVLVRTATLREVGGFDAGVEHFDDWYAWLRLADRGVSMCSAGEVVAEWRVHDEGLSGLVSRNGAMKARLLALFDRLAPWLSVEAAAALVGARRLVLESEITTYDDYVELMARVRAERHAAGECFGRRLPAHHGCGMTLPALQPATAAQ